MAVLAQPLRKMRWKLLVEDGSARRQKESGSLTPRATIQTQTAFIQMDVREER